MAKSREQVESFIQTFKDKYPEAIENTFLRGHCYWFAHILAARFKGDIWFNPNIVHFAAKISGNLYDVCGIIMSDAEDWVSWLDFQLQCREAVDDIVRTCIKKVR